MSRKSNNLDAAKEWFDLERYSSLIHFGRRQWGQQIVKRALILQTLDEFQNLDIGSPRHELTRCLLDDQIEHLKDKPLMEWVSNGGEPPLREIWLEDMESIAGDIARYNDLAQKLNQPLIEKNGMPLDSVIGHSNKFLGHLRINLAARDADILSAFGAWLQQRRQGYSFDLAEKAIRKDATNEWFDNRLIPFTDLQIWERFAGFKLTEEQRVDLLFPDDACDYRVRHKATKDAFDKYMTSANGSSLVFGQED